MLRATHIEVQLYKRPETTYNFISVCVNAVLGEARSEEFAMGYHLL